MVSDPTVLLVAGNIRNIIELQSMDKKFIADAMHNTEQQIVVVK